MNFLSFFGGGSGVGEWKRFTAIGTSSSKCLSSVHMCVLLLLFPSGPDRGWSLVFVRVLYRELMPVVVSISSSALVGAFRSSVC